VITVTHEETTLTYTGDRSWCSTADGTPARCSRRHTPIAGRTLAFTLARASAQTCGARRTARSQSCTITVNQSPGPTPIVALFAGDAFT
jgi:hypothetical protein